MNQDRVLITGGAGFIGHHTSNQLVKSGYQVTIIDVLSPKVHGDDFPQYLNKNIIKIKGDVRDKELMVRLLSNTDYVIHLAAEMDLNPDFQKFMDVNVGGTALIYEIIIEHKLKIKKVLIASSQFVYGEGLWKCNIHGNFSPQSRKLDDLLNGEWEHFCPTCGDKAMYIENTEVHNNPPNHYALSKYFQEELGIRLGKLYQIPTVAMRYSIVHGPMQSLKNTYSGALRNFAISIKIGRELASFEDNCSKRDFISVYDVASANQFLLECDKANYEVLNIGGNTVYSISELASIVAKKLNMKYNFSKTIEFRLGDIRHAISSSKKILDLGWNYSYSEDFALDQFVKWFDSQDFDSEKFLKVQKEIRDCGMVIKCNNYDNK